MKNFCIILLLISYISNAQKALDNTVVRKLEFMHYIDHEAVIAFTQKPDIIEHFKNILANNPVPEIDINTYLGIKGFPQTIAQLTDKVSDKNSESLMEIIREYGYPSLERLAAIKGCDKLTLGTCIFFERAGDDYKKQFRKLMKTEYKNGNVSAKEYKVCKLFLDAKKGTITVRSMERAGMKLEKL